MLRLKREDSGLIFELKPPFDDEFFEELKSTIRDFMKIGKKSFSYDFKHVEILEPYVAKKFEDLIPVFKAGKCSLKINNAADEVILQLPEHRIFMKSLKSDSFKHSNFSLDKTVDLKSQEAVMSLNGEFLEQETLEEFKSRSSELMEEVKSIILDFKKLNHISTIAVGGLIYLKVHCDREGKNVVICNASPSIKSTLEMSGILHIIPVFNSLREAKSFLRQKK
jgi:anti-anti-sigma factor